MQRKIYAPADVELKSTGKDVVAAFSIFNEVDSDGDVVLPGAIPHGVEVPMSAFNHKSWEDQLPVGKGVVSADAGRATFTAKLFDTTGGRDTYETLKQLGPLARWSWGFDVIDSERGTFNGQRVRFIKKVRLFEVSPVLRGANDNTRTLAIKSANTQRAILESAKAQLQQFELEDMKRRLDAEMCLAQLIESKDRFMRDHGSGYSTVAESMVDIEVKAAAWAAVHRYAPRLGLNPDAVRVRFFTEEVDYGTRTRFGDKAFGPEHADFFSMPGIVIKGLTRPSLEPTVIHLNAELSPDEAAFITGHEAAHLAGMDEAGATAFEDQIRKEISP
ncbi:HK97 family phage prohead protease [Streptomyces sp. DG2A-72]|uniref:HK97 family phage prohead protease n=1 Tax=Streptomyces sp. DG2A-72 TaxID=3051386 RepID=UPI00265C4A9A|nr:HK97 family phage prohead protease [Streptomyces sp. DG2A-72]MDO0931321.1 HK97 family phage prohead protease [Streptomyces sp. DG2A-72]